MRVREAVTEIRRRLGLLNPYDEGDIVWFCERIVRENKEVFDALA